MQAFLLESRWYEIILGGWPFFGFIYLSFGALTWLLTRHVLPRLGHGGRLDPRPVPQAQLRRELNETSKFGKLYQNTTAYYNGYWNSKEILKESMKTLRQANIDDYNQILAVEDFVSLDNPKMVKPDMDKIIEKVTTVAQLHEASDWVDDCYVMMAKAQYLKQEYETAEETLEYFQEDFNPSNPYGRNYKSKKPTGKADKKEKEAEKKKKDEAKQNNEAVRLWISGLEIVAEKLGLEQVVDLSATPFFLKGHDVSISETSHRPLRL